MTKLNKLSFYILLPTYAVFIAINLASAIIIFATLNAQVASMLASLGENLPFSEANLRTFILVGAVLGLVFGGGLNALFIVFIIRHKRKPFATSRYLIFMLVLEILSILGSVLGLVSLFRALPAWNAIFDIVISFVTLALAGLVIFAVAWQFKKPIHVDFAPLEPTEVKQDVTNSRPLFFGEKEAQEKNEPSVSEDPFDNANSNQDPFE